MGERKQRCSLAAIGRMMARVPVRQRIGAALVIMLMAVIVASTLGGLQTGILAYHAIILTVLAWIIYRYARSTDAVVRATISLNETTQREDLLTTAQEVVEQKIMLHEFLEELRKAEASARPPFDLTVWERCSDDLNSIKELSDLETEEIASCYRHLTKENLEANRWQDLEAELHGLVDCVKRRTISLTLKSMEQENLAVIRPVVWMLERHLKGGSEFSRNGLHGMLDVGNAQKQKRLSPTGTSRSHARGQGKLSCGAIQ